MRCCGRSQRRIQHVCYWCHTPSAQSERSIADGYSCASCGQWNGFDDAGNYSATKPADQPSSFTPSRLSRRGHHAERGEHGANSMELDDPAAEAPSMFAGSSAVALCAHCQSNQELLLRKLASFDSAALTDSLGGDDDDSADRDESFVRFKAAAEAEARLCLECQQRVHRLLSAQDEAIRRERIQEKQRMAAPTLSTWRKINVASGIASSAMVDASSAATPPKSASWIVLHLLSLLTSLLLILSHCVPAVAALASRAPHLEDRATYTLGEWLHASLSHWMLLLAHWARHEQEFALTMLTFLEVVATARRSGASSDGSSAGGRQRWTGSVWGLAQLAGLAAAAVMFVARTEWVRVSLRVVWMLALANLLAAIVRTIVLLKRGATRPASDGDRCGSLSHSAGSNHSSSSSSRPPRGRLTPTSAAFDFGGSGASSPPGTPLRSAAAAAAAAPRVSGSGANSRDSRSMGRARAADAPAVARAEFAATTMRDAEDSVADLAAPAASKSSPPQPMNDGAEEHKHAPAPAPTPLPVPTQSLRSLMTQQAQAASANPGRLSPLAALLADEEGLAQQDEDESSERGADRMHDQDPQDSLDGPGGAPSSNDSVGEIEFEPSLVSLDGPAANRARFSHAQTQALAASVWPLHQRLPAPAAARRQADRKSNGTSNGPRRRGRSNLRDADEEEEDESSLPAGLEEESDDAHYLDYNYAHSQQQLGAHPSARAHASHPRRTPHAREGSVELMPGSLFSAPPDHRRLEQQAAQPNEAFGGDAAPAAAGASLMTDSPGFGANAASSLISSIDLATAGDASAASSSSNPIARASHWLFTEVVKRSTPLFGSTAQQQHALALPVQQLPPAFAAGHQPVFGHAAIAASSALSSASVFHSPLSSPLGRFSTSPSQTLFPSASRGGAGGGAMQLSPPSFVASEEQIRRAVSSSSSRPNHTAASHDGAPLPPRRPRRRSLESELAQSIDAPPAAARVLLKRREAVVASVIGLCCYVAKESSSVVSVRASALLLYGLLLGAVAALLIVRSTCGSRSSRGNSSARNPQRPVAISCRSRLMLVAASVLLLVLSARALSQATALIDSLTLAATTAAASAAASSASAATGHSATAAAALSDPLLSRLSAALSLVQRLQSLLKDLLRALVRWVSRHAEILLMIAAVAGIACTQRARA